MLVHQRDCAFTVPRQSGLCNLAMLPVEVSFHPGKGARKPAVAFGVIEKHRPQMKEPGAAASRREDFMKNLVSLRIFVAVAARGLICPYRRVRQTMQCRDDLRLPFDTTFFDGTLKAQRFNAASNVSEIAKGIDGQWRNTKTSLGFADDKPF